MRLQREPSVQAGRQKGQLPSMFRPPLRRRLVRSCLASAALILASVVPLRSAHADDEGATGRVVRLTVNTQSSDKYASFHGSLTLRSGAGKNVTYFWGGTTCPAQRLGDAEVALLATMLTDRRTLVAPRYRTGEGARGARCLVAFELLGG
jgi:hypothetical protein